MAVVGGVLLILIGLFIFWITLMGKFDKIGKKVTGRIEKTFGEDKGENKQ